jgi:hypothetical protein
LTASAGLGRIWLENKNEKIGWLSLVFLVFPRAGRNELQKEDGELYLATEDTESHRENLKVKG